MALALPNPPPGFQSANHEQAQQGLSLIKSAVLGLLYREKHGLTNAQICHELGLAAGQEGKLRSMLSWSILGLLVKEGKVRKAGTYYFLAHNAQG
ncbi:MAG: hypothetical protein MI920_01105 [Kiloniellales bacterium]|nr:hypothetical protein [Kiloniellales bacterium]